MPRERVHSAFCFCLAVGEGEETYLQKTEVKSQDAGEIGVTGKALAVKSFWSVSRGVIKCHCFQPVLFCVRTVNTLLHWRSCCFGWLWFVLPHLAPSSLLGSCFTAACPSHTHTVLSSLFTICKRVLGVFLVQTNQPANKRANTPTNSRTKQQLNKQASKQCMHNHTHDHTVQSIFLKICKRVLGVFLIHTNQPTNQQESTKKKKKKKKKKEIKKTNQQTTVKRRKQTNSTCTTIFSFIECTVEKLGGSAVNCNMKLNLFSFRVFVCLFVCLLFLSP